jgi:hypothetical protein
MNRLIQRLGRMFGGRASVYAVALTLAMVVVGLFASPGAASAANGKVLILEPTVEGGAASREAKAAEEAGQTVEVVSPAEWEAKSTAQFAEYDALVIGDPDCTTGEGPIAAADANAATWNAAVGGNVVVIGTDPDFHSNLGVTGAMELIKHAMAFAVEKKGATGAYVDLSCYYADSGAATSVPMLAHISPFGGFKVYGQFLFSSCPEESHIVATSPALQGLTDEALSHWGCSAHEAFEEWPADFEVLAINANIGSNYTASDGTVGGPYILARGATVISDISLTPLTAKNTLGSPHTLTATVNENGKPVAGTNVTFTVIAGPNTGVSGTSETNSEGKATFTYTSKVVGTDVIHATFVDSLSRTETSNTVEKEWVAATASCSISDTQASAFTDVATGKPVYAEDNLTSTITSFSPGNSVPEHLVVRGNGEYFKLTGLTSVACHDNKAYPTGAGNSFNTVSGVGPGTLGTAAGNGKPGYMAHWEISDRGDQSNGTDSGGDTLSLVVRNGAGAVVWQVNGTFTTDSQEEVG